MVTAFTRITREYNASIYDSSEFWSLMPTDESLMTWTGNVHCLPDSRHAGKNYSLEIKIPENYPFVPPKLRFTTYVECENVFKNGEICIDILYSEWSPIFTIQKIMHCICSVLTDAPITGLKNKDFNYFTEKNRRKRRTEVEMLAL